MYAGITGYAVDDTQGPACALACAAGTVYRNYFACPEPLVDQGQSAHAQINNLVELEKALGNDSNRYWRVHNGYVFSSVDALQKLDQTLMEWESRGERDSLLCRVRVGLHRNVGVIYSGRFREVTSAEPIVVNQVFCAALSCAYSGVANPHWNRFACLVLDAAYESTVLAAIASRAKGGSKDLFLTFIGGGVFGNEPAWISNAIKRAIGVSRRYHTDINIIVCHFHKIDDEMEALIGH